MREETLAIVRRMQDNEATDQRVYAALAKQASLQKNSEILEKMSHDEGLHCAVWGRYTGIEAKADMFRVWLFVVLGKIFGLVFVINLMEGGEDDSPEAHGGTARSPEHHGRRDPPRGAARGHDP